MGIVNISETQIIFYDTPGSNFLKTVVSNQKKLISIIKNFMIIQSLI